eukprot:CAMPEP_0172891026 /NCGR_PEP_ID=MMETSP1075-20121228/142800_1 /TAXON_ID=2916 /ORGANISM="Ceratium fusus, Strain PA161109" /LENGTH=35 /DNA_ID= /DNA_START= /DNA_END= /DNA_ORIENTATION=
MDLESTAASMPSAHTATEGLHDLCASAFDNRRRSN